MRFKVNKSIPSLCALEEYILICENLVPIRTILSAFKTILLKINEI